MYRYLLMGLLASCVADSHRCAAEERPRACSHDNCAWRVRYHAQDGNKHGDLAIQFEIKGFSGGGRRFSGVLYRYDALTEDGRHYKLREVGGIVPINGSICRVEVGKKIREQCHGSGYYESGSRQCKVEVVAFCHPGEKDNREDDRLVLEVNDRCDTVHPVSVKCPPVAAGAGKVAATANECGCDLDKERCRVQLIELLRLSQRYSIPGEPKKGRKALDELEEADCKEIAATVRALCICLHACPCDEEPDDDVLEEEPFEDDLPYEEDP